MISKGMQVKNKKIPTFPLKTLDHIPIYGIIKANVGKMYFNTYIYLKEGEEKCYYHIRNVWKNMERIIK